MKKVLMLVVTLMLGTSLALAQADNSKSSTAEKPAATKTAKKSTKKASAKKDTKKASSEKKADTSK